MIQKITHYVEVAIAVSFCVLVSLFLLRPAYAASAAPEPGLNSAHFKVKETANKIEIEHPWGAKSYETDFALGAMKHYKIEIPLEDLRPATSPLAERPGQSRDVASAAQQTSCELPRDLELKDGERIGRKPDAIPDTTNEYDSTDRLILEANHLYNRRKFYEASVYVEELIRKNPAFVRAWVMKGSLLYMQGHVELAKKAWAKAAEIDPADPQVKDLQKRYP